MSLRNWRKMKAAVSFRLRRTIIVGEALLIEARQLITVGPQTVSATATTRFIAPRHIRAQISRAEDNRRNGMRAVRIHQYGGPETLRYEDDVPDPAIGPDTVLIGSVATSVNPIDWKLRSGTRQKDFPLRLPAILGRDVSGTVLTVGSEVRTFKPGDRVIAMADATYAQLVAVPEAVVAHLPDGVDPVDAAAIPLVSLTGDQLVRIATRAAAGQTILVSGALGSVGRAAVHTAKKLGATVIVGVRARQLADAESLGAHSTVALDDDDALARLDAVDGVADTVGGDIAAKLIGKVRVGGRFGYASVVPEDAARGASVEMSRVFAQPDPSKLRAFADDVRDGSFVLPISRYMPLRDAGLAHELLEKGGGGKIVLTM
ncbi:NADP-dependent oxidoreductase [Sphingomonas bacterium]|uniref:NADP-dependent oxidoreductase n=1 Tax=Sphingomonas bacterium TaxID=1895847 RepID=UPI001C2D923C|nr:NADP-dependent oxidoreductase [Sphingomonas bacterium]